MPQNKKHRRAEFTCDASQDDDGLWVLAISINGLKYEEVESLAEATQASVLEAVTDGGRRLHRITDMMRGRRGTTQ
jgi:hypothetical protein